MGKKSEQMKALAEIVAPMGATLSPERERLAEAIAHALGADGHYAAAERAAKAAEGFVREAETALEAAEGVLTEARQAHTERVRDAALAGKPMPDNGVFREARTRAGEAEDEVDAARQALAALREPLGRLRQAQAAAEAGVLAARGAVLRTHAPELLDALYADAARMLRTVLALSIIAHHQTDTASNVGARSLRDQVDALRGPVMHACSEFHRYAESWGRPSECSTKVPDAPEWLAYVAALTGDPSARPPA